MGDTKNTFLNPLTKRKHTYQDIQRNLPTYYGMATGPTAWQLSLWQRVKCGDFEIFPQSVKRKLWFQ